MPPEPFLADPFRCFLRGARATQRVGDTLIPFVARKFEERALDLDQPNLRGPGAGPRRWIVGGEFVDDGIVVSACEALHQMETGGGSPEGRLVREIRGVDYQRIALPTAA